MADQSPNPIPDELRTAFHDAVAQVRGWTAGRREPVVSLRRKPVSVSTICELVMSFTDPMPENVFYILANMPGAPEHFAERSYGYGARCLLKMIEHRQAQFTGQ